MINFSSDKFDKTEVTIQDGEYKALIFSAEFNPDVTTKKGPAAVFNLGLKLKSGPFIDKIVNIVKYVYEGDEKSERSCTYFFSSLAKLGVDVLKFRKSNDMRGLMEAVSNKWVTIEARTKGEYQNISIKGKAANIPVALTGGKPSDGLNFTQDATIPPVDDSYDDATPSGYDPNDPDNIF